MPNAFKLIFIICLILFSKNSLANNKVERNSCSWGKLDGTTCLEIIKHTTNSSKFTNDGINKIIISKKQIDNMGAVDLIDALSSVTDLNITQSGPKGQQASVFMRGTGSNHVLVMINGIPINDQSTTQGLHDFGVDFIQTIQQIEIYPGSSASHFGTNSIGGAINIILTNDYKDQFFISGDKDENYELTGNKAFIYDNSSLNIKLGNVNNKTVSARGSLDDEKDEVKNYSTNINYENYVKPNLRLFSTVYLRQTLSEYDGSASNQKEYDGDNKMATIHLGLNNIGKNQKQNSIIYYTTYDREYDEEGIIDKYQSEVLGLKYDLSKTINDKFSFGLGSDYKYDWGYFDNKGSYSASTKGNLDNLAVYSNLGINLFPNSNLSFFLRNDNHKQTGNNSSYKINLNQIIGKFEFGLSRMTGLRNPTLYELYGTDNYGYSGNRNLKAERSLTNEFYAKYLANNNLKLSTTLFKSNINNNIEYLSNRYVNDADNVDLNQSGINGNIEFKKGKTNLNLFGSLLSSNKEDGSNQLRRPEKTYGINISKEFNQKIFGKFNLNLSYDHYGKHFDTHSVNFNTIEMDSTDIVNIGLSKKIKSGQIYFKVSNLLKETYQRPHGYNQDGRIIKLGIRY